MKAGEFVYIEYVGRIKDTGEIFDLTDEGIAKKEKIFDPNVKYGPVPVIIDSEFVLKGLNDALKEMKVGEKKKVDIPPEKGFGQRSPDLIKLVPETIFKERDMEARPGSFVNINNIRGRIVSVDGGRVKVDFNHPLAGKMLEYELKINKKIEDKKDKIESIACYFTGLDKEDLEAVLNEKEVEVKVKNKVDILRSTKESLAKTMMRWIEGLEKVKFAEIFEKEKEK